MVRCCHSQITTANCASRMSLETVFASPAFTVSRWLAGLCALWLAMAPAAAAPLASEAVAVVIGLKQADFWS
jgi:hypothetical protein